MFEAHSSSSLASTRAPGALYAARRWFAVLLLLTAGACAAQTPAPLTMQQAVDLARMQNPSLLSAGAHVTATKQSEITAGLRVNPNFNLTGSDVSLAANSNNPYFYSAQVSRLFERGQKRRWRLDAARSTTDVTRSQYADQERQLVLAVRTAFTQMLGAKGALDLAKQNVDDYRKTVDLSRERLRAGDISATDFKRLDLQLAQFESDYDNAHTNFVQASAQLQTLLGYDRPHPGFDITGSLDPPSISTTLPDAEQKALQARPDYLAAQQSVRVADANVKLAYAEGTTDPTIEGEYDRAGTANSAGFQIGIPLRIFDRNQGEKARTKYEAQSSRFAETAVRNQVVSDVDQAWAAYEDSLSLARRYNGHYLQEAHEVRDNLEYSYRHGGTTLIDYLSALQDYRQVNLDALNADMQVWLSLHQVSFAAATEIVP
ncbi:MAG TPA: TolC family protein [Acidobacteriaceae bacterium]|nr:TolC family protein [Acidobacteriaceae bacterium]